MCHLSHGEILVVIGIESIPLIRGHEDLCACCPFMDILLYSCDDGDEDDEYTNTTFFLSFW